MKNMSVTKFVGLLVCLLLCILLFATASAAPSDFQYTMKGNGTAVITGYVGQDENVYIPKMLDGYTVSAIADNAFQGNATMITVSIPDSITSIGDKAFFKCSNLTGVTIPASVQTIGAGAFAGCEGNITFAVDRTNPVFTTIDQILYNKKTKTLVCCPRYLDDIKIPEGIVEIGEYSFYRANIYNMRITVLPESITTIKAHAFENAYDFNIETIDVSIIEEYAFYGTEFATAGIKNYHISAISIGEYAFAAAKEIGLGYSKPELVVDCMEIAPHTFEGVRWDGWEVTIMNANKIGECAFKNFGVVGSLNLPETLTYIGNEAFYNAKVSKKIAIPASVKSIGDKAFAFEETNSRENYSPVKGEVVLPSDLESIGDEAFNIPYENTIIIPERVTEIGENICNRKYGTLEVVPGSYAAVYAAENGYKYAYSGEDDLSWLN